MKWPSDHTDAIGCSRLLQSDTGSREKRKDVATMGKQSIAETENSQPANRTKELDIVVSVVPVLCQPVFPGLSGLFFRHPTRV